MNTHQQETTAADKSGCELDTPQKTKTVGGGCENRGEDVRGGETGVEDTRAKEMRVENKNK